MKLWLKFTLSISVAIVVLFGAGGYFIAQKSFDFSLEQIIIQYQKEHINYRIFFDTMVSSTQNAQQNVDNQIIINSADLITINDITEVYKQKDVQYKQIIFLSILLLIVTIAVVIILSIKITQPLKQLTIVSKKISNGAYGQRANVSSNDEIGILSHSFNQMAEAVEEKVVSLEKAIRAREDFVADYIYKESKQINELSLKLMDLMSLSEGNIKLLPTNTEALKIDTTFNIIWELQPTNVLADKLLIQRVLYNLCSNSQRAGANNIMVCGSMAEESYIISVVDNGCGISSKEIMRITEPFYRADKVCSRENDGFGLGLALCEKILKTHKSFLEIESIPNVKTTISFKLSIANEK